MGKSGIIITLFGVAFFFISIFTSEGYDERRSLMGNIYSMEVEIFPGRLERGKPVESASKDEPSGPRSKEKDELFEAWEKLEEKIDSCTWGYQVLQCHIPCLTLIRRSIGTRQKAVQIE